MIKNKFYLYKRLIIAIFFMLIMPALLFSQDRKIKAGDAIEIIVYGHEELSRKVYVSPQGSVDFPFMQNIPVDGLTLDKLREVIVAQLTRYLTSPPVVTLSFAKSASISVSVLGHIANPGIVSLPLESRLQGAIGKAGMVLPGANVKDVTLLRDNNGKLESKSFNIELFLLGGDLIHNPVLKDGDVIVITYNPIFAEVKVLGCVNIPGKFNSFPNATVLDMIILAGGFTEEANQSKVQYISLSQETKLEIKIDFDTYFKNPESIAQLPQVKPGDIIIVPTKKSFIRTAWGVVKEVMPLMQIIYWVYLIRRTD